MLHKYVTVKPESEKEEGKERREREDGREILIIDCALGKQQEEDACAACSKQLVAYRDTDCLRSMKFHLKGVQKHPKSIQHCVTR